MAFNADVEFKGCHADGFMGKSVFPTETGRREVKSVMMSIRKKVE